MRTTTLADAKNHLSEIISSAQTTHERTTVTKNGRPAAVIVSVEDWESIERTLETLSDPEAMASVAEAEITGRYGLSYREDEIWNGSRAYSPEEQERRLVDRMGADAHRAARVAVRTELLASDNPLLRERARDYELG